jgi:hypothetical protein
MKAGTYEVSELSYAPLKMDGSEMKPGFLNARVRTSYFDFRGFL